MTPGDVGGRLMLPDGGHWIHPYSRRRERSDVQRLETTNLTFVLRGVGNDMDDCQLRARAEAVAGTDN